MNSRISKDQEAWKNSQISKLADRNEQRRQRFLDARSRTLGVNVAALDEQCIEKQTMRMARKAATDQYDQEQTQINDILQEIQMQQAIEAKQADADLANFWSVQKDPTLRREWDLSDPNALRNERPARDGLEDPRCGASGAQKFAGEDLYKGDRVKLQQAQMREWVAQQSSEKQANMQRMQSDDMAYASQVIAIDNLRGEIELQAAQERMSANLDAAAQNQALSESKRLSRAERIQWENELARAELEKQVNDPMLCEDRSVAQSVVSANRVRRDHWKGMDQSQLDDIRAEQLRQIEEKKMRREAERAVDRKYAEDVGAVTTFTQEIELARAQERMQALRENQEIILAQKAEKAARDQQMKELYSNKVDGGFFSQFGTSCR